MQLGLDSDKDASEQNVAKVQQREAEMGDVIQLVFHLPSGEQQQKEFRSGHLVQYVKAVLHHEHGLPMSMVLMCNEKKLIDPLSVSDCPTIRPGQMNVITVQV